MTVLFPHGTYLEVIIKKRLTMKEFKRAILFFACALVCIVIMEIVRSIYDVSPNSARGLLPAGFNHWIPEWFVMFFLGASFAMIARRWLGYSISILTILAVPSFAGQIVISVLPLAIIFFLPAYFTGYLVLPKMFHPDPKQGSANKSGQNKRGQYVWR